MIVQILQVICTLDRIELQGNTALQGPLNKIPRKVSVKHTENIRSMCYEIHWSHSVGYSSPLNYEQ